MSELIIPDSNAAAKSNKSFKSSFGVALTCLGAAVGTGNIWRYPRIVANNTGEQGSLGFIIVWIFFLFTWSIPVLVIEYGAGRFSKSASILTFKKLGGKYTMWCGAFIGFVTICIAAYYAAICGWCVYHVFYYIVHPLPDDVTSSQAVFYDFTTNTKWPVFLQAAVVILSGACVFAGVRSIEPIMLGMVPVLLVLMIGTFFYSLTLPKAWLGIRHLFSMDWAVFARPNTWIEAMTQNAWDTGAGSGTLLVYASYMRREHGVVKYSTCIPAINNFMSLLMVITIFSTVFSAMSKIHPGYTVDNILETFRYNGPANTGLTFVWIPILFTGVSGGRVLVVVFFLCLFIAGFSSQVSMIETAAHQLEDLKVPRKFGVPLICGFLILLGLGSSLSVDFLVNQDYVWGSAILVSGGMFVFLMIRFGVDKFRTVAVNEFGDGRDWRLPKIWNAIVWVVIPVELACLLVWWIVQAAGDEDNPWYYVTGESLMSALLQWGIWLAVLVTINLLYVKCGPRFLANSHHILHEDEVDYGATADTSRVISNSSHSGICTGNEVMELRPSVSNDVLPTEQADFFQPSISSTPLKGLAGRY